MEILLIANRRYSKSDGFLSRIRGKIEIEREKQLPKSLLVLWNN